MLYKWTKIQIYFLMPLTLLVEKVYNFIYMLAVFVEKTTGLGDPRVHILKDKNCPKQKENLIDMSIFQIPVKVHMEKRFIAAYSTKPFWEHSGSRKNIRYPDYAFDYEDGIYWCYRIGMMRLQWGIAYQPGICNFHASGELFAERQNMRADSFDHAGMPFEKEGDIHYLYDRTEQGSGYNPEQMLILNDRLRRLAIESGDPLSFLQNSDNLRNDPVIQEWFARHYLKFQLLTITDIGEGSPSSLQRYSRSPMSPFMF